MPRKLAKYLDGDNIYACRKCGTHLAPLNELISKAFMGESGKAYLFNNVINVRTGNKERKKLRTGIHETVDLFCNICDSQKAIGWKYVLAEQPDQKYKEGKFILEKAYLEKQSWIDD